MQGRLPTNSLEEFLPKTEFRKTVSIPQFLGYEQKEFFTLTSLCFSTQVRRILANCSALDETTLCYEQLYIVFSMLMMYISDGMVDPMIH